MEGGFSQNRLGVRTSTSPPAVSGPGKQEGLEDDIELTSLNVEYDMGWATLSSSTSWVDQESQLNRGLSFFFPDGYPFSQSIGYSANLFSEEVRIASNLDGRLQFLLGFYYEDKETEFVRVNLFGGVDPALIGGSIFIGSNNTKRELEQKAIFGELAHDVADDIKFTFGARSFDIMETFRDRRPVEVRSDVLTYTTAPFTEPLTILGDIELAVFGIRVLMG